MEILKKEKNKFVLKISNLEDLWILTQFVVPENVIYAKDKRKVSIGTDRTKQVIKLIPIHLKVKKTNFENNTLKVLGELQNQTEFTAKNSSHTLNFRVGDIIEIQKQELLNLKNNF